jgi:shikimate 5-dehydrogenase
MAEDLGVSATERPLDSELIVKCAAVGLDPAQTVPEAVDALDLGAVDAPAVAFDLVYRDGETPFAAWARGGGSKVIDGLEMLVMQGARSFSAWTGAEAPVEIMRQAARR